MSKIELYNDLIQWLRQRRGVYRQKTQLFRVVTEKGWKIPVLGIP